MTDDMDDFICLGAITGAQGIKGEVIIRSFTQDPANIDDYGPLTDREGTNCYDLKVLRVSKKGVIARISGVDSRNGAEELKGTELYVRAELLPEPEPGEFYYRNLIGLAAVDEAGTAIGEIKSVQNFGAGDLLEIRLAGSDKTEFLPFNDDYVIEVSLENKRISIKSYEGFWD